MLFASLSQNKKRRQVTRAAGAQTRALDLLRQALKDVEAVRNSPRLYIHLVSHLQEETQRGFSDKFSKARKKAIREEFDRVAKVSDPGEIAKQFGSYGLPYDPTSILLSSLSPLSYSLSLIHLICVSFVPRLSFVSSHLTGPLPVASEVSASNPPAFPSLPPGAPVPAGFTGFPSIPGVAPTLPPPPPPLTPSGLPPPPPRDEDDDDDVPPPPPPGTHSKVYYCFSLLSQTRKMSLMKKKEKKARKKCLPRFLSLLLALSLLPPMV